MKRIDPSDICIGVVGLGLMGSSIIVSLLKAGHRVIGIAPLPNEVKNASQRIREHITICQELNLLDYPERFYERQLIITENYDLLDGCRLILECVVEQIEIKKKVYKQITSAAGNEAIVASNTSAIPISILQEHISSPERFLGIHWAEPAYTTRFLEIICGKKTSFEHAEWIYKLAHHWGKEPTLLKKDINGFITNRLMYAVCREALGLVECGHATLEDVDKSFRYDAGSWMTLMGVFRRMDYLGVKNFIETFRNVFPELSNSEKVPEIMQRLVDINAKGVHNSKGLYEYTKEEVIHWDQAFKSFNGEIHKLATLYPSKLLEQD